jgi:hypothetical protein
MEEDEEVLLSAFDELFQAHGGLTGSGRKR